MGDKNIYSHLLAFGWRKAGRLPTILIKVVHISSGGKEDENRIWGKTCQYIPYYILKFEVCENIAYSMN